MECDITLMSYVRMSRTQWQESPWLAEADPATWVLNSSQIVLQPLANDTRLEPYGSSFLPGWRECGAQLTGKQAVLLMHDIQMLLHPVQSLKWSARFVTTSYVMISSLALKNVWTSLTPVWTIKDQLLLCYYAHYSIVTLYLTLNHGKNDQNYLKPKLFWLFLTHILYLWP